MHELKIYSFNSVLLISDKPIHFKRTKMSINKSTAFQEKVEPDQNNISKLITTQSVIRNKFKKAYANRLGCEHDQIQVMKPLTITPPSTMASTSTAKAPQTCKNSLSETNDINVLCNRLEKLMNLRIKNKNDVNCNQEIKCVIMKLRELGIIVE